MAKIGGTRALVLLSALAVARFGFAIQFQAVASLAPLLSRLFGLDYTAIGTLIVSITSDADALIKCKVPKDIPLLSPVYMSQTYSMESIKLIICCRVK